MYSDEEHKSNEYEALEDSPSESNNKSMLSKDDNSSDNNKNLCLI